MYILSKLVVLQLHALYCNLLISHLFIYTCTTFIFHQSFPFPFYVKLSRLARILQYIKLIYYLFIAINIIIASPLTPNKKLINLHTLCYASLCSKPYSCIDW